MTRFAPALALAACTALISLSGSARAGILPPVLVFRAGGALAGPQQTVSDGFLVGAAGEWNRASGAFALNLEFVHDDSQAPFGAVDLAHVGFLARWRPAFMRPYAEAGAGVTWLHRDDGTLEGGTGAGPAAWFGAGVPFRVGRDKELRFDARYQMMMVDISGLDSSANAEDYFSIAASIAFGD